MSEHEKYLRELRLDCGLRRMWISSGRWDSHPTAIADWRREIVATENYIRSHERDESPELGA